MKSTQTAVAVFLGAAAWLAGAAAAASPKPPSVGSKAPDFTIRAINGTVFSLSAFKGKIVVLEWTNPGCPMVQRLYKTGRMQEAQESLRTAGVIWLAVNSTNPKSPMFQPPDVLKASYAAWQAKFLALLPDPEGKVGRAFDAQTTPHLFVVGKDGRIAYSGAFDDDPMGINPRPTNYVQLAVRALLSNQQVSPATTKSYGCAVKYAP